MKIPTGYRVMPLLALVSLLLFSVIQLQAQDDLTYERVKFKRGRSSATIKGKLPYNNFGTVYIVGASAGQRMTVHASSPDLVSSGVFISGPVQSGGHPHNQPDLCSEWSDDCSVILPEDGDYYVYLLAPREEGKYSLTITIR